MTKYKVRTYHTKGRNKGDTKEEFFFNSISEAKVFHDSVYDNKLGAYNPTIWKYNETEKDYIRMLYSDVMEEVKEEEEVEEVNFKNVKKLYDYNAICKFTDKRVLPYAMYQLERQLGYEPQPIELFNVLWNEHFKVVAY